MAENILIATHGQQPRCGDLQVTRGGNVEMFEMLMISQTRACNCFILNLHFAVLFVRARRLVEKGIQIKRFVHIATFSLVLNFQACF